MRVARLGPGSRNLAIATGLCARGRELRSRLVEPGVLRCQSPYVRLAASCRPHALDLCLLGVDSSGAAGEGRGRESRQQRLGLGRASFAPDP